jgi:hypothetical protein
MLVKKDWSAIEKFAGDLEDFFVSHPLTSQEAKILQNQIRIEKGRINILAVNARYTFSIHSDFKSVPENVNKLLEFLCSQLFIDWNGLYIKLETIWRNE